jgi:hypothetical protein
MFRAFVGVVTNKQKTACMSLLVKRRNKGGFIEFGNSIF